jgi:hypothetical protein
MRSLAVHGNREVVNYNKVDSTKIVEQRMIPCYNNSKEKGTDERFWTLFDQDWYASVLMRKTKPVVQMQWIHFDYMRKKKDATFNKILEACDFHGITKIMEFRYNWNKEIISQFYSTLYFDKKETIFMSMADGRRFNIKLSQFVEILGMSSHIDNPKKRHSRHVMTIREMAPLYVPDSGFHPPHIDGLLPHLVVLHRMLRWTMALRIGDANAILAYEWNLLEAIMKNEHLTPSTLYDLVDLHLSLRA